MSTYTITFRARETPIALPNVPPCCGLLPTASELKRQEMTVIRCSNSDCPNHSGVLDYSVDAPKRWSKFVEKVEAE